MPSIHWMRRDLRLHDSAALAAAGRSGQVVQPVFVFDTDILARFSNHKDRRLSFIAATLCKIDAELRQKGAGLLILHGSAKKIIPAIAAAFEAEIFAAEDYEPEAIKRDAEVAKLCGLHLLKDQLIFSPKEITRKGEPYKVYTPYSKTWLAALTPISAAPFEAKPHYADYASSKNKAVAAGLKVIDASKGLSSMLAEIGYEQADISLWPVDGVQEILADFIESKASAYGQMRDMVAESGTSRISPYLRFGLISVRECLRAAQARIEDYGTSKWLSELIWREFYAMTLFYSPESAGTEWNQKYRGRIRWSDNKEHFEAWKNGQTGYPIIDAAMRQLLATGWMHNRARMIVASFLTKDLHIDWRLGEEHFAQHLMDYDMASNVGGWQWAASTGTDAQPWFRIFNPYTQSSKFDPKGDYIRRYVPELAALDDKNIHQPNGIFRPSSYPLPMIDHALERQKSLAMFKGI